MNLKFDHTKDDVLCAMGYRLGEDSLNSLIEVILSKPHDLSSELAEIIHNSLDYEVILLLATRAIEDKAMQIMIRELREFLGDESN